MNRYAGEANGETEPVVYDEAARIIENWEQKATTLSLTAIN